MNRPSTEYLSALRGELATILDRAREIGARLAEAEHEGCADDPRIRATVTGHGALRRLEIEEYAKRELDRVTMGEYVGQAINRAIEAAQEARAVELGALVLDGRPVTEIVDGYLRDPRSRRAGASA
jgi:DNA-binding protein YbaB